MMERIDVISWEGKPLAYVVRAFLRPDETSALTARGSRLRWGLVADPEDGEIACYAHLPLDRAMPERPTEVLVVKHGQCRLEIYNDARQKIATRMLRAGDVTLSVADGHGFEIAKCMVLSDIERRS
jgi:hypothetical protein